MSRNLRLAPEEYYHIYNRGTEKREIFLDNYDYERFIKSLYLSNSVSPVKFRDLSKEPFSFNRIETIVDIGAYCLMPNHFHILVKEHTDGGITKFMTKLLTSHSSFINKKYKRSGTLFEGPFKVKHADTDEYLKYLFAYIHLNPVKLIDSKWKDDGINDMNVAKDYLTKYRFSSYLDYCDHTLNRKEAKF